jgi:hypothetical protein
MAKVDSTEWLVNVKSTDGRAVFNASDPKLGRSAPLFTNFHSMVSFVDPDMLHQVLVGIQEIKQSGDMSIGFTRKSDGSTSTYIGNWIDRTIEALNHTIADIMIFVR